MTEIAEIMASDVVLFIVNDKKLNDVKQNGFANAEL